MNPRDVLTIRAEIAFWGASVASSVHFTADRYIWAAAFAVIALVAWNVARKA